MFPNLWDVLTIDEDAASLHIIKTEKQADDGTFSWSGRTNLLNKILATILHLCTLSYSVHISAHYIQNVEFR